MIHDTDIYTVRPIKRERTEDGDLCITWEVRVKGRVGAEAFCKQFDRYIATWTGCGNGWMRSTYFTLVDGAVIAIEARNDAWAQQQQDIEDRCRGLFGY